MTFAVALTVLAPALCLLEARHVYRAGLVTVTFRTESITSPTNVSSTEAPEIWRKMTLRQKDKSCKNQSFTCNEQFAYNSAEMHEDFL